MTDAPDGDAQRLEGWAALAEERAEVAVTVFMSDPSAEAERVAQLLRAAGYAVADVPLSMLATRVAVQTPRVVVVDADAAGASDVISSLREGEHGQGIEILLLGENHAEAYVPAARALSDGSAALFARPVDAAELVRKIDLLTGGPGAGGAGGAPLSAPPNLTPRARSSLPPAPASVPPRPAERASPVPASMQPWAGPLSGRGPPSSAPTGSAPLSARSTRPSVSIQTALSAELEALLAEADQRIGAQMTQEASPPTPEEELEAVLPAALLAALDEPIDEDEDDALVDAPRTRAPFSLGVPPTVGLAEAPPVTNAGRVVTPAPPPPVADELGVAATMAAPPLPEAEPLPMIPEARVPELSGDRGIRALPPSTGPVITLGPEDAPRQLALAIATRESGCVTYVADDGIRRVVLRDGDVLTAASSADDEGLLDFLTTRGELRRDQVKDLVGKVPPFGRHAGAALVAHGLLRQDQLWPTLRAHAEWVLGRTIVLTQGTVRVEPEAPGRLRLEPSVFGGSSGAEVLVEAVRRVVAPEEALARLGGVEARITDGPSTLLSECALDAPERELVVAARGGTLGDLLERASLADFASVIYALSLLGVIVVAAPAPSAAAFEPIALASTSTSLAAIDAVDALDVTAVRERVRARFELVLEADYFTLLGVPRTATGYDVRRAYLELRRSFEPSRILTPEIVDLDADVRTIVRVLDEAYEILRDGARRERYRRALGDAP